MKVEPGDAAGMYFLIAEGRLVYVGSAENVYARLGQHRANGRRFDEAFAMWMPAEDARRVERVILDAMLPELNCDHRSIIRAYARMRKSATGWRKEKRLTLVVQPDVTEGSG